MGERIDQRGDEWSRHSAEEETLLLDDLMPVFDVAERHRTTVAASPEHVFAAIRSADLGGGRLTRALMALRVLPAALVALTRSPRAALIDLRARRSNRRRGLALADFERAGFSVVMERAPKELVIGLLGRFWTPRGGICAGLTTAQFAAGPPAGYALAGWNFSVTPLPDGQSELRTETRVWCAPDALTKFRAYWLLVSPGSALIRREMLGAIRREAESFTRASVARRARG